MTVTDCKLCESVVPALSITESCPSVSAHTGESKSCGIVLKADYLNSVHAPAGDSQHLYDDNCHLAASARFIAEAPVRFGECKSLQGRQSFCKITTDGFIWEANSYGRRVSSKKNKSGEFDGCWS